MDDPVDAPVRNFSRDIFDRVPGLFLYPAFFSGGECASLTSRSLELQDRLELALPPGGDLQRVGIPQPAFVRSAQHNLPSEEFYARIQLAEAGERALRCEYFPRYGEDGHSLCYFRGNANLPDFINDLLPDIQCTMEDTGLAARGRALTWKCTLNWYRNVGGTRAGFPFHVDIPANGVVTMILNVHQEALFQIALGEILHDVPLPVGGLLILSGPSRYEWKHRVLPGPATGVPGRVERVSLVLGFQ
jgi:hypothetical protein